MQNIKNARYNSYCALSDKITVKMDFQGQVDSPEFPETPETTEIMDNFIKVTKYLTKLKEALINYVWEKSHFKKH